MDSNTAKDVRLPTERRSRIDELVREARKAGRKAALRAARRHRLPRRWTRDDEHKFERFEQELRWAAEDFWYHGNNAAEVVLEIAGDDDELEEALGLILSEAFDEGKREGLQQLPSANP